MLRPQQPNAILYVMRRPTDINIMPPFQATVAFLGGIYSEYVGREILNNGVGSVSQLCLEFSGIYLIDPDVIQRYIVDQHHILNGKLYQKYFCNTREFKYLTTDWPNTLSRNGGKVNRRGIFMNDFVIGTGGKASRLQKIDELKATYETNWKYYVEYKAGMTSPIVLEVVNDPTTQELEFVTLNDGELNICGWVQIGDRVIMPPSSSAGGTIKLPEAPVDYVDIKTLESEIEQFIHSWCDVSSDYEKIAANYAILTWIYDKFYTVPYLRAMGDFGSGKSRFLDTVGGLCYRSINIAGATSAAIYRLQNMWKGTIVWDEADLKDSSTYADLVKILNLGFERGHNIPRCGQNDYNDIEVFDPFGPKILGTRNKFTDNAFESRCFTEIVQPTTRDDIPQTLNDEFHRKQIELQNKLLMFRLRCWSKLDSNAPNKMDLGDIDPRLKQIATPLAVIIEMATPNYLLKFKSDYLQSYQEGIRLDRADTEEGMVANVILDLRAKCNTLDNHITYIDIQTKLNSNYDLDLTPQKIGYIVKGLGINKVERIKIGGKMTKYFLSTDPILDKLAEKYGHNISKNEKVTA